MGVNFPPPLPSPPFVAVPYAGGLSTTRGNFFGTFVSKESFDFHVQRIPVRGNKAIRTDLVFILIPTSFLPPPSSFKTEWRDFPSVCFITFLFLIWIRTEIFIIVKIICR